MDRSKECKCPCHTGGAMHCMPCGCYSGKPVLDEEASGLEREMVDLIRSIMYSGTAGPDDNDNTFYDEVQDLGKKLAKYDGVKCSPAKNRLIQIMDELKKHPDIFKRIEHLNDD